MTDKKRVVIVGAGALGSHLALLLRNHADIKVVDFDRVEAKNCMSQLHAVGSVGKNKALALQQAMKFLFGVRVEAVPHKLVPNNVRELLESSDLVVDCVDNGETRRLIQGFCRTEEIPCLHGALAAGGQLGQVCWTEKFEADDAPPGAATCEDGEHLPFIATVASLLAVVAQGFVRRGSRKSYLVFAGGTKEI
jgi:shikimate 5-dehydrogenase